jgi:GH25 family lysozyme M1 (1,4-beta-N-acetylmuramidase)
MRFHRQTYFDCVREHPFPGYLTQAQVDGQDAILARWEAEPIGGDLRHLAYALATTMHETGATMQPIEEYGKGQGHSYGVRDPQTGQTYYGRGFVQLTWRENYANATHELGLSGGDDLEWHAERALDLKIAGDVMFRGMAEAWFRPPHSLGKYFNATTDDAYNAREIINADKTIVPSWSGGVSIGKLIKAYHEDFLAALTAAARGESTMATPKRMALDLSHHNSITDFDAMADSGIVGIIHKASEGDYMTDDKYAGRRNGCREHGLMWGAYHFATNDDVDAQVDLFLRAADPDDDTMMVLDWEPYGDKQMTKAQAREFIEKLEERTGRPGEVVIYSGNLAKEELDSNDTFFGERRLWLAHYSSSPSAAPPWSDYWLWQYSDGAAGPSPKGCPGVSGEVDTNSFDGSAEQLRAEWASGEPRPMPEPKPARVIITITIEGASADDVQMDISDVIDTRTILKSPRRM